jgi:hypothetical protein
MNLVSIRYLVATILFGLVLALMGSRLRAQETSPPAPQPRPPFLASVPRNIHWIVSFSYISQGKNAATDLPLPPPEGYPVSIETTKVGKARHVLVKFADGSSHQYDFIAGWCLLEGPKGWELVNVGTDFLPYMFFDPGFLFTQCVSAGAYKDYTKYQGVPAFHYLDDSTEAWIAVDTMLPLAAQQLNFVKVSYHYLATPDSSAIVLTPEEQKLLQERKMADEAAQRLR